MKSLMQNALGEDWALLPQALKSHYQAGPSVDTGHLAIAYPSLLQPYLSLLHLMGALINRKGSALHTVVKKQVENDREYWRRAITFPDGKVANFTSFRVWIGGNQFIEYVNAWLGLQLNVSVKNGRVDCQGIRFLIKIGKWHLPIPEWMALGHTTIHEHALDDSAFAMDFRMTHPIFGEVFRYCGEFNTAASQEIV